MEAIFYEPPQPLQPKRHPFITYKSYINYFIYFIILELLSINYINSSFLPIKESPTFYLSILFTLLAVPPLLKLSGKKIFLIGISSIIFFGIAYLLTNDLKESYKIMFLWLALPVLLIFIANEFLIDIPFYLFIKIHTYRILGTDLFTNTKLKIDHHTKNEIYIDVFPQNRDFSDKKFEELEKDYVRLVKFWYAQSHYLFQVRYFFPLLAMILSPFIFFCLLDTCHKQDTLHLYISITIFLFIFYLTITYHINSLLHSKFYMGKILQKLNSIYFDHAEYRHQLKQFLDKNFLIYIHDKKYDRHFCVNTDKNFQKFISQEKVDKEGRNSILTVFISFILIAFIEMMVNPPS